MKKVLFKQTYYIGFPQYQRYNIRLPWICYGKNFYAFYKTRLVGTDAPLF